MGLAGLLGSELQSSLGRGLVIVAAPWWVAEDTGHVLAGAVVALAIAGGWLLGRSRLAMRLRAVAARQLSWIADCAVALALTLVLMIDIPPAGTVAVVAVVALALAALQHWATSARSGLVDRLAVDAHVDPPRARRWLAALRRWLPWVGAIAGVAIVAALSPTVAMWICFGLFLQGGEFVFVAVLSAPALSETRAV